MKHDINCLNTSFLYIVYIFLNLRAVVKDVRVNENEYFCAFSDIWRENRVEDNVVSVSPGYFNSKLRINACLFLFLL